MSKQITILIIIVAVILIGATGYFAYLKLNQQNQVACTMDAKICPDGSSVGRGGPNCDFIACPEENNSWKTYKNNEYGFEVNFPDSWKGYTVENGVWQGQKVDGSGEVGVYKGTLIIIKNPQSTQEQKWQNIPIMVFTKDVWQLVQSEKVAVSAAPIPPEKIGENAKYIFATPPRWYGFTDDVGYQEAVEIVKTFKAF
jgi:hypothetical protein